MSTDTQNTPKTSSIKRFITFVLDFPPYLYFPVKMKANEKPASDRVTKGD
ncbi:hypothetical protein LRP49_18290 [Enterovibrio sp. ZSDZ35]|uniref:Uncharacterized protein n=1 Tax=Enterovibrio qingdaonensis TaxID=2899818 RepID=A0ABT5QRI4_9GAMM|nr:hypothetical protein [Enterovibrio sp. ZSDZ35]MDD1783120.1 hypothetical protein [Enterovibrio sp. ZSDZ35]